MNLENNNGIIRPFSMFIPNFNLIFLVTDVNFSYENKTKQKTETVKNTYYTSQYRFIYVFVFNLVN